MYKIKQKYCYTRNLRRINYRYFDNIYYLQEKIILTQSCPLNEFIYVQILYLAAAGVNSKKISLKLLLLNFCYHVHVLLYFA